MASRSQRVSRSRHTATASRVANSLIVGRPSLEGVQASVGSSSSAASELPCSRGQRAASASCLLARFMPADVVSKEGADSVPVTSRTSVVQFADTCCFGSTGRFYEDGRGGTLDE